MRALTLCVFLAFGATYGIAYGGTIDFSDLTSGACNSLGSPVESGGFTFTNLSGDGLYLCDGGVLAQNTSPALISANSTSIFSLGPTAGGTFSIQSFSAGTRTEDFNTSIESSTYGTTTQIDVLGTYTDSTTIDDVVTLSGLSFGTFTLPNTFANLTSVQFTALGSSRETGPEFAINNITVNAVPEPASFALLGLGLLALGFLGRSKIQASR